MSHSCSVCDYFEELPVDHELYLEHILTGYWNFNGISTDEAFVSAEQYIMTDPAYNSYIRFGPDRSCRVVMGIAKMEPFDSTWTYVDHLEQNGIAYYYISVPYDDGTFVFMITRTASGQHLIIYVVDIHTTVTFTQDADTAEPLSGCWGIEENKWGNYLGDCSYWFQFNKDRTVSGFINGAFEGIWHPVDIGYDTYYNGILIEYKKDGKPEYLRGTYSFEDDKFYLVGGTRRFPFQKLNQAESSVVQNCTKLLIGSWTSVYKQDDNRQKEYTASYSIDFLEDGSFTADFNGRKHKGTWIVDRYDFIRECANEKIPYRPYYLLNLYFDGQKKSVYCHLDAGPDDIILRINADYPHSDGRTLCFMMLDEAGSAAYQSGPTMPLGTWSESGTRANADSAIAANEPYLTFHDDGTFTGMLDAQISGTWEFSRYQSTPHEEARWQYKLDTEDYSGYIYCYIEGTKSLKMCINHESKSYYLKNNEAELAQPIFQQGVDYTDPNAQVIVGRWTTTEMIKFDKSDPNTPLEITNDAYDIIFLDDGTFSANLLEEMSGKWKLASAGTPARRFEILTVRGTINVYFYSGPYLTYIELEINDTENPNHYYRFHLRPEQ